MFGTPQKSSRVNLFKTPTEEEEEAEDITPVVGSSDDDEVTYNVPPVVITQYVKTETSETMALVLVTLPSGVTSCYVTIDPENMDAGTGGTDKVIVHYEWGVYSYDPYCLYKKFIENGDMSKDSPKIQAIYNGVKKFRTNVIEAPKSTITIKLPITVQVADNKWRYNTIANIDEKGFTSQVLEIEFTELQTSYTSKKSHDKATFKLT